MVHQVKSLGGNENLLGRIFIVDGSGYGTYEYRIIMPGRYHDKHTRTLIL